jgi:hypothetical protein
MESERLEVLGPAADRDRLGAWLNLGPVTKVESRRSDAVAV